MKFMKVRLKGKAQFLSKRSLAILLVIFVGLATILITKAASSTVSLEAEGGATAGNISIQNDSSASGGGLIKFGQQPYTDLFVSATGSDSRNGSTEANAVKTITKAVQLASGHTRIRIMAGNYLETIQIQKSNLIIEPYGNGDVNVIGAIPELVNGASWSFVQSAPGGGSIYKAYINNRDEFSIDGNPIYTNEGKQWWTYPDLIQLQNLATVNNQPGVWVNNFLFDRAVYVATKNGLPPTAPLYVGSSSPTIWINNANNISIKGIANSKLKLSYGSKNIDIRNSNNITVNNTEVVGGTFAINALDSSAITVTNNKIRGEFERSWTYSDVKERPNTKMMENSAVHVKTTSKSVSNIVVNNNEISGYWSAIYFATTIRNSTDPPHYNDNSLISDNHIFDIAGPGIEPESHFRNLIIENNRVYDTYDPFSPVPALVGPIYVYENLFVATRPIIYGSGPGIRGAGYSIKMNSDQFAIPDNIHYYHNTFYFSGNPDAADISKTVETKPDTITKNLSFINNIFYSFGGGIVRGSGRAQDNIEWDGNIFYSEVNDSKNYYSWNSFYGPGNEYNSLSSIISAGKMPTQWQGNAEGNPNFNCVTPANNSCFRASASITKPGSLQPIPSGFAESSRLNSRTRIGAFE